MSSLRTPDEIQAGKEPSTKNANVFSKESSFSRATAQIYNSSIRAIAQIYNSSTNATVSELPTARRTTNAKRFALRRSPNHLATRDITHVQLCVVLLPNAFQLSGRLLLCHSVAPGLSNFDWGAR
ncbi:hypothetical protein COLO4_08840 [Corchorus olitorius]|uniref:Uncharacterized protein n=1 Tax=Corchorus olitorius TaxID=93759 RepID=A0A1R3KEB3_9ROSI|nr:hypothetical protein COLO4_08840 [Corchorus olitorius]